MAVKTYALTTRQRLIDFLGLGSVSDTTKQNVLDRIIDSVTEYIEKSYCNRRFQLTTYTNEVYDGEGSDTLLLKNFPVTAVTSVQIRDSVQNEDSWETVDTKDYYTKVDSGIIKGMAGYTFPTGPAMIRVTYSAGFDFNTSDKPLSDTQAADLEYACWKLCAAAYNQRKGTPGISQEALGDYSVTFTKTAFEDEEVKSILEKYKRIEAIGGGPVGLY